MHRDLARYVRAARVMVALTVTIGVLVAAATIVQMSLLSHVVARVFLAHAGLVTVRLPLTLLCGVIAARAALLWLREVITQWGAIRVKCVVRERLCAHLLRLGPAYMRDEQTGELVATASAGVERLDAYVARYLPQAALSVLVPPLIAAYIFPLDWPSAVLLLVTAPIIPLLMILIGSYTEQHVQSQWTALARMSAHVLDAVQGLPTLILFGGGAAERDRIARISTRFRDRTLKVLRLAFLSGLVLELMSALAIALVAVTLGVRLLDGGISFQRAFLVLLLAPEFYRPLRELGVQRHAALEGKSAAGRIVEILRTPLPSRDAASSASSSHAHGSLLDGPLEIALRDVAYTYPGSERPALKGVTLTLAAGTRTALVGRSGAGKTTLVNLLLRFLDASGGAITVDGLPLDALPVESWRTCVALVPQRPYLFSGSVRDNIRLARPSADDVAVARAARLAGADEFIARLPRGYDTPIGERGARLSMGQAQRLALARAFLKDAPVLLLDEPTSHLDPASEALIRRALERLMHGRTVLVAAHRLNTIYSADQVAVLDEGRIVEAGRHEDLLRRDGAYARLMGAPATSPAALLAVPAAEAAAGCI